MPYSALYLVRQWIHVSVSLRRLSRRQAHDARHHGRHAPEGQLPEAFRKFVFLGDDVVLSCGSLYLGDRCPCCAGLHYRFPVPSWWRQSVRFLTCPLLRTTCAGWSRQCRIAWRCRRCCTCAVVDVAVFMQRQVPGSPGRGFRSVHRQVRDGLKWAFFPSFLRHFSPSVQLDVRARVAGTRELAPRRSATPIRCIRDGIWPDTSH